MVADTHIDYWQIIHKHLPADTPFYPIFVTHAVQVTAKALQIARQLQLSDQQLRFIEEASMLHDIGIIGVSAEKLHVHGDQPYICHSTIGSQLLRDEGLLQHALVAERHTGVGITLQQIQERGLPLPHRDLTPQSLEEKIISYADLFFSKSPHKLWGPESVPTIKAELAQYGAEHVAIFDEWHQQFGRLAC